ncbi:pyridoxal kinase [Mucor mucedo]|uniref:pyridoxal kinase n=1 Tax=Mucor mucedo TaxID=29922 RepID=UPI00221ECA13|nr:pyridoxal kinase [Mucor mucedo]KAI7869842.1 pyridoxal kinase [Mucor mucedo]
MVEKLKAKNPKLIYVCDTVMGDGGAMYVAPEIIPLYRNIMRLADVVTPNQFEAELLTETKISSLTDACLVAKKLHALGSAHVVITTLSIPLELVPLDVHLDSTCEKSLYCFTSQVMADGTIDQHIIAFPTFEGYFTGTGDLFSSLVVARLQESMDKAVDRVPCLIDAAYRVICTVNAITKKTFVYQQRLLAGNPEPAKIARIRELHLIQGKKEIEEPERIGLGVVKKIRVKS